METITGLAVVSSTEGQTTIRFDRFFQQSPEVIWKCLTETDYLSKWFPADLRGEKEVGAPIRIVSFSDKFPPVNGVITCFQPYSIFEYLWEDETLRWEINDSPKRASLTFLNKMSDAKAKSTDIADIATAWHSCLDVLHYVVKGQDSPYTTDERFIRINASYKK